MHQSHASSISRQVLNVTQAPQRRPPPVTLSGGRASSGAPPGAGPDQAGQAALGLSGVVQRQRQHLLVLHFHALCKPYVDENAQPLAGSVPSHEEVVVNIDSTVSPLSFLPPPPPVIRRRYNLPSSTTQSPPPPSPPLGSSDPSSLFFFPCSMKPSCTNFQGAMSPPLSFSTVPSSKLQQQQRRISTLTSSGRTC